MRTIKKILIEKETGKKFFLKESNEDYHTSSGVITSKDLQSGKEEVISTGGKHFFVLNPSFTDLWENLHRGPQIMLQKDIGLIIAKTGLTGKWTVLDAGGGSGSLCFSLANVCKKVVVYEQNAEHHTILVKNKEMLGMKNVVLKKEDIYQGIAEKNLDLITLDLPEPWRVIASAEKALTPGGFLAVYLPNLTQVYEFIQSVKGTRLRVLETVELLERKWKIEDRIMRPEFQMLGHTGFLTFCRKL